ncbi:labd-13Z-ene-9,15,16-triol synthase, chloroplastic-like [Malania oleifera]|uniref:labd-13Z-ene-9,15,16-triol synthase, chloroplastic-like n=1 Tax=Malania oleifera TaxID=397392 RepID=UPI0025AEA01D|nr:labd-13Z-ene-9,15,16-triol synthase, chloroplastic-like [Malania oleifera]
MLGSIRAEFGSNINDVVPQVIIGVISVTLLSLIWLLPKKPKKTQTAPLPPGPYGLPLLGYIPFLDTHLCRCFTNLAAAHGPIFKLWLGTKMCVVVNSPEMMREVMRDQDQTFANRDPTISQRIFSHDGNDIAFAPYGADWRLLRKVFVRELLSNANLDDSYALRRREVRNAARTVYGKAGAPVDIGELAFLTSFDAVTSMLWGGTLGAEEGKSFGSEFRQVVMAIVGLVTKPNVSDFFPALARLDLQGIEKEMRKIMSHIDRIFDFALDRRVKMGMGKRREGNGEEDGGKDFLQFLVELREKERATGESITLMQTKAMLWDIVAAGTDTTATTVEWAMAEVMNHPEILQKLHEELANVVGPNNAVEEAHLSKLTYLNAVVKETLRLHPAFPFLIPHSPSETTVVGGYTIPKGTRVFINVWAVQRDPKIWPDPLEFRPDRFLGSDAGRMDYLGKNYHYLPFGSGRRICAGLPLAERMTMHLMASFLHLFRWRLPEDTLKIDFEEKFGIVMKKAIPLVAIPTPKFSISELYE